MVCGEVWEERGRGGTREFVSDVSQIRWVWGWVKVEYHGGEEMGAFIRPDKFLWILPTDCLFIGALGCSNDFYSHYAPINIFSKFSRRANSRELNLMVKENGLSVW